MTWIEKAGNDIMRKVVCYAEQEKKGGGKMCREIKTFGNNPSWISTVIPHHGHTLFKMQHLASCKFIDGNRIQSFCGVEKGYKIILCNGLLKMFTYLKKKKTWTLLFKHAKILYCPLLWNFNLIKGLKKALQYKHVCISPLLKQKII